MHAAQQYRRQSSPHPTGQVQVSRKRECQPLVMHAIWNLVCAMQRAPSYPYEVHTPHPSAPSLQDVYDQLVEREKKVRKAEQELAEAEAEGLRRLKARDEEIDTALTQREARISEQVHHHACGHWLLNESREMPAESCRARMTGQLNCIAVSLAPFVCMVASVLEDVRYVAHQYAY